MARMIRPGIKEWKMQNNKTENAKEIAFIDEMLKEAESVASSTTLRYTHEEVFERIRSYLGSGPEVPSLQ